MTPDQIDQIIQALTDTGSVVLQGGVKAQIIKGWTALISAFVFFCTPIIAKITFDKVDMKKDEFYYFVLILCIVLAILGGGILLSGGISRLVAPEYFAIMELF